MIYWSLKKIQYRTQRAQKLRKRRKKYQREIQKEKWTQKDCSVTRIFLFCFFCATFAPSASGSLVLVLKKPRLAGLSGSEEL
jgi:hypothetical protein